MVITSGGWRGGEALLTRTLGTERGRAASRLGASGLGSKSQLCSKVGELGQRAESVWASVSSPAKWERG